jgi:ribosomal protein S18 acetylase RimI-like enzyme
VGIQIREAKPSDQASIVEFNSRLADETEGKQLDPNLIGPGVAAILADSGKGRYWLAIIAGKVAGQIMVTYEWSDWRNGMLWWIQSVYVPAEFRRMGVFSALYQHVESLVKEDQNACGLRLYVENNNTRAQQTYRNLAMTEPGYIVMQSIFPK